MNSSDFKSLAVELHRSTAEKNLIETESPHKFIPQNDQENALTTIKAKKPKRRIYLTEMCGDTRGHTGGRKHKGHDRCIRLRKRGQAEIRQAKVKPERTAAWNRRMQTKS